MSKAATSSSRVPPFRSGQKPICGHPCCTQKYDSFMKKQQQQENPPSAAEINANSKQWFGPCGVATIFFRRIHPSLLSPTADASASSSSSPSDSLQGDALTQTLQKHHGIARMLKFTDTILFGDENSSSSNVSSSSPTSFGLVFYVGFDINRSKNSICSGTLADSWPCDLGCAVKGAMREASEEFKFDFKNEQEFIHLSYGLFFWENNTVCFPIDLDKIENKADPRRSLEFLHGRTVAAAANKSLPMSQREIRALSPFVIQSQVLDSLISKMKNNAEGTNFIKEHLFSNKKKSSMIANAHNMSEFALICVGKSVHKIITSSLRSSDSKKVVTVATAVVNKETPLKKEDAKEGNDVNEENESEKEEEVK